MARQFHIIFVMLAFLAQAVYASDLKKGNSAFLYGRNNAWISQIKKYNAAVPAENRISSLFPLVGRAHVSEGQDVLSVTYDPSVTAFYKTQLPHARILANISFRSKNSSFGHLTPEAYVRAADQIARVILADPSVDGVHLDVEIYGDNMLPFYRRLSDTLRSHGKITALFASSSGISEDLLEALGDNAMIVLYGYDLFDDADRDKPVSPDIYKERLKMAVRSLGKKIHHAPSAFMVGIPAVATVHEWEYKTACSGSNCQTVKSGYRQQEYFSKALEVIRDVQDEKYMGYVIWAFVDNKDNQAYLPLDISDAEWEMMEGVIHERCG